MELLHLLYHLHRHALHFKMFGVYVFVSSVSGMKAWSAVFPENTLLLLSFVLLFSSCSSPFADIDNLPEGTLINVSVSPDGKYTVRAHLCGGSL